MARYKEYIFVFSCYIDVIFLEFIKRRKSGIEIAKYDRDSTTASKLLNKLDQPKSHFYFSIIQSK